MCVVENVIWEAQAAFLLQDDHATTLAKLTRSGCQIQAKERMPVNLETLTDLPPLKHVPSCFGIVYD